MPLICGSDIIKPIKSGGFHLLESWVPERATASFIEMEAELAFFVEENMGTRSTEVQTAAERNSCVCKILTAVLWRASVNVIHES